MSQRLVVHVPHASVLIPPELADQFVMDAAALAAEAETSADLWTDLLAVEAWPGADVVAAGISRLVVDVERFANDSLERMAAVGRGVTYTHTHDGRPLRRPLTLEERDQLLRDHYRPHWTRLKAAAAGGVLVDLHSYPASPWPIELYQLGHRPEIDIGTDPVLTPVGWRDALLEHFTSEGYDVALDTPYEGVINAGAKAAVMVEIRRDILGIGPGSSEWHRMVDALRRMPLPD